MSKSNRVRASEELAIVRLVSECGELGDDAAAWQTLLLHGLLRLTGGLVAGAGPCPPPRSIPSGESSNWVAQQLGGDWPSDRVRERWERLASDPDAIAAHPAVARFWDRPEPTLALTRRELLTDDAWDRAPFVNDWLRADGLDEGLVARGGVPAIGGGYVVTVVRAKGDRPFSPRAGLLAGAVQQALAPHLGRRLLLTTQPNRHGLTRRLREVLDCLLEGDSEKQTALRLGLRPNTVHDRVKRLYLHFGVSSRAELLAYFLRCYRPDPAVIKSDPVSGSRTPPAGPQS